MAEATNLALGTVTLTGDLDGTALVPTLRATGVLPGTYNVANLVVNQKGLVLDAVEGDPEDLPCASTMSCGLMVVGDNLIVNSGQISIPLTTTSNRGVVKSGTGFKILNGVLNLDVNLATEIASGVVSVPTSGNLLVDGSGNLTIPIATSSVLGICSVPTSYGISITGGTISFAKASAPTANTTALGFIKIPSLNGLSVDGLGSISLEKGTSSTLGVVSVPSVNGLSINSSGAVLFSGIATDLILGQVQVGSGLTIDEVGQLTTEGRQDATYTEKGLIQADSSLYLLYGNLSLYEGDNNILGVCIADETTLNIVNGSLGLNSSISTLDTTQTFSKSQVDGKVTLTAAASLTPDCSLSSVFDLTLSSSYSVTTINNPTGLVPGAMYNIIVRQPSGGGVSVVLGSYFKTNVSKQVSRTSNAVSTISFLCVNSTTLITQIIKDYV